MEKWFPIARLLEVLARAAFRELLLSSRLAWLSVGTGLEKIGDVVYLFDKVNHSTEKIGLIYRRGSQN
jgi:hypothetical protein